MKPWVKGAWHLWLYETAWRIEAGGALRGGSGDTSERKQKLQEAVGVLSGLRLDSITIAPLSGDASFRFAEDIVLRTFSMNGEADPYQPHWRCTLPGGESLEVGPGSGWHLYSATGERVRGSEH
jgi:hypothetical protein